MIGILFSHASDWTLGFVCVIFCFHNLVSSKSCLFVFSLVSSLFVFLLSGHGSKGHASVSKSENGVVLKVIFPSVDY